MKTTEIKLDEIYNAKKKSDLKKFIDLESAKQSEEEILTNKLLAIQYKLEDYIQNEQETDTVLQILDFVKMYLKVLKITKKKLADHFEIQDSNLHKYLTGERKLNPEIALKLSAFSNTKPEHWYSIQVKNELLEMKRANGKIADYQKYSYRNIL
ncbi:helix-turn-helix transcriptional regulator [Flavobacterium aurantiibacter]|uniref:Transcriptional regulator n=1 Tax=Flavobacterium aurantiibacter TaxID=2023067 RepID=A0A255ZPM6_9FLAO|nr:transcriptional regulator [Flavobacterium aurantiibacter]OYQ43371.1 transcriptional regulator [Flavobacterium aurantiibacter]